MVAYRKYPVFIMSRQFDVLIAQNDKLNSFELFISCEHNECMRGGT
jgi:hypothetical protein